MKTYLTFCLLVLLSSCTLASTDRFVEAVQAGGRTLAAADKNQDGKLSVAEIVAAVVKTTSDALNKPAPPPPSALDEIYRGAGAILGGSGLAVGLAARGTGKKAQQDIDDLYPKGVLGAPKPVA